jgi:hypothetical protein
MTIHHKVDLRKLIFLCLSLLIIIHVGLTQEPPKAPAEASTQSSVDLSQVQENSVPSEPQPVETIEPPGKLQVSDTPNDAGTAIDLTWVKSPSDEKGLVLQYRILRSTSSTAPFKNVGIVPAGQNFYQDMHSDIQEKESEKPQPKAEKAEKKESDNLERGKQYYYQVEAVGLKGQKAVSNTAGPVIPEAQWIHTGKIPVLVGTVLFFFLVVYFIESARRGKDYYVRPIAGMAEIDNAIGRATEMGRPILYVLGLGAPDEIATIASYTILARVAKKTAEYRTSLIVPCNEPIVMTIAQETVRNAYMEAGHPEAYSDKMVFFLTSMQFAYVAAVNGIILRERTATNCYFGKFYAESLLLSETGNVAGSIQVAGTDEVAQLPFFVTTCDYTLIGEELYAASAYLGRDPLLLGALKAQDYAKALTMILIIAGTVLVSFGITWIITLIKVAV